MKTLGELLREIYQKDTTFRIEEPGYAHIVRIVNRDESISVETEGLAHSIEQLWRKLYRQREE